jgi:hypothetical protein
MITKQSEFESVKNAIVLQCQKAIKVGAMKFRRMLVLACDCQGFNIYHEQIAGFREKCFSLQNTGDVRFHENFRENLLFSRKFSRKSTSWVNCYENFREN